MKEDENKFLISYSPIRNQYIFMCIGDNTVKEKLQERINAYKDDQILLEVSQEKYFEIYNLKTFGILP